MVVINDNGKSKHDTKEYKQLEPHHRYVIQPFKLRGFTAADHLSDHNHNHQGQSDEENAQDSHKAWVSCQAVVSVIT